MDTQGKLCEASLQFVAGCEAQRTTAEILRPSADGFRMTDGSNFAIRVEGDLTDDASLTYKPSSGYWGGASAVSAEAQGSS